MIIYERKNLTIHFIKVALTLIVLVFSFTAFAQRINIQTNVDKDEIEIGAFLQLSINIYIPKGVIIHYPEIRSTQLQNFEIIESGNIDTVINSNDSRTLKHNIILTSYDTGIQVLPALKVPFSSGGNYDTAVTNPIEIKVSSMTIDFSQDIKDIKPPVEAPFNWREIIPYLFYIISFLLLVGGGIYAWIYYRKNNVIEEEVAPPPIEPAYITALRQLDSLKQDNLIHKRKIREFHERLTDHLRRYIQGMYDIHAMEKTTEDILQYFKDEKFDKNTFHALEQILTLADQVKFAKVNPPDNENELSLKNAYHFVNNTRDKVTVSQEH